MSSRIRVVTAFAVVGLCGFALSGGLDIVRFTQARASIAAHHGSAHGIESWAAVAGLAGAALEMSLTRPVDSTDVEAVRIRAGDLAAILSVRPVSPAHWLSLASMRIVAGEPPDKALGALELSSLTGANEGQVMAGRGIFGLWQWRILPPIARKRMMTDLARAMIDHAISDQERSTVARLLTAGSANTRREIADLLRAAGLSLEDLRRVGL